jgi:hypothetical protein
MIQYRCMIRNDDDDEDRERSISSDDDSLLDPDFQPSEDQNSQSTSDDSDELSTEQILSKSTQSMNSVQEDAMSITVESDIEYQRMDNYEKGIGPTQEASADQVLSRSVHSVQEEYVMSITGNVESDTADHKMDNSEDEIELTQKAAKRKPARPCPFCSKMLPRLQRHIKTVHKDLDAVKRACALPGKDRNNQFKQMKRQGIFLYNKKQMALQNPQLQRERRRTASATADMVMCGNCNGFFVRKQFWRHRSGCIGDTAATAVGVPTSLLKLSDLSLSQGFRDHILSKFRNDDIGKLCTSDQTIISVGAKFYDKVKRKQDKIDDVRKTVRMDMRRLANLFIHFREIMHQHDAPEDSVGDSSSMFLRQNFAAVEEAVNQCTVNPDVEDTMESLKAGLKQAYYFLMKRTAKILKTLYLIKGMDSEASEVDKFTEVLSLNQNIIFGDAAYKVNIVRQSKLRRPQNLPSEEDCQTVRDYTVRRVAELTKDQYLVWTRTEFAELRDLTVSRLTLFNARRGGEPARLTLNEWSEATKNTWINEKIIDKCDGIEQKLFHDFKLTYQSGKGINHIVPILFPPDTVTAMNKLSDVSIRAAAGVHNDSKYVFPSTKLSLVHVSGWHAVNRVAVAAGVAHPELMNATKMRHYISTLYAARDVPENSRQIFYKHMGHSDKVNQHVYQAPLSHQEITHAGFHLKEIDNGTFAQNYSLLSIILLNVDCVMYDLHLGTFSFRCC